MRPCLKLILKPVFLLLLCFAARGQAQLNFIQNQGQWNGKATYRASLVNGDLWLTDSGLLFSIWDPSAAKKMHDLALNNFQLKCHAFYLHFKGGDLSHIRQQGEISETYYNYFLGNDPRHWKSGLHASSELYVTDLYPGVDLKIYSENGNLKYNLVCHKPENIALVRIQYLGVNGLEIKNNHIEIHTSLQDFVDAMPAVYGEKDGTEELIPALYELNGTEIHFNIPGNVQSRYSKITIDPVLVFSTYSGSTADNFGCTGTYDDQGHGFAGGTVFNPGFPVSLGAFQRNFAGGQNEPLSYGGGRDIGILKFSADGKSLLYATYLGGRKNEQPHSLVTMSNGDLFIMGSTRSDDFPMASNAQDPSHNGDYDFYVARLSFDGTSLIGSTYFGGSQIDAAGADRENNPIDNYPLLYNYADEFRGEIITDGTSVYVSGITYSPNFPRSNNSGWFGGKEDGVVFCMDIALSVLNWSQDFGSNGHDAFYGLSLGLHNDLYVSGASTSSDLPARFSKFNNTYKGGMADGIAARFNKTTGQLLQAAYLGTAQYEQAYFSQTDNSGNPYFYGQTEGAFPNVNAKFYQAGRGQFIVRLDTLLTAITMSTSFGANSNQPNISPSAFLVDRCERIFISGWGGTVNTNLQDAQTGFDKAHRNTGWTKNMVVTADAQQKITDGSDFYIAVFSKNMNSLQYVTFFGGITGGFKEADEHVDGGTSRFDKRGIIYQAVCAGCGKNGLFPTTPGAYSRTNNSFNCNNALFKIDFENLNKKPTMADTFIQVVATDKIDISRLAVDPDPYDTVLMSYTLIKQGGVVASNSPVITVTKGLGSAGLRLIWNTDCDSYSSDTVTYKVMVFDRGCPNADTTYAYIKILVTQPPLVIPQYAICVSYDRNTQKLKIAWPASIQSTRFFNFYLLKRNDAVQQNLVMDTIFNTQAGIYTDNTVVDPQVNNYCYFMEGYNTCGVWKRSKDFFCTLQELNTPITGVYVKYATVELDKRVKIEWTKSKEPDFKEYELYRYPRGGSPAKVPLAYLKDTVYVDSSFNVDAESNCYSLMVTDLCGHASGQSNPGCNVVITGSANGRPDYYFDLNWQNYIGWPEGVHDWALERQYADKPFMLLANTDTMRKFRDDKLDFDWGGYYYRVNATEQLTAGNRAPALSQSNWIYLYQPPELWIPNAFTPNENGLNDVWGTVPVFVRSYSMKVYSRWGQKIWESSAKHYQWDGKVDGRKAEDGVYAWYVIFDGWDNKTYRMKGTVTVIH